MGVCAYVYVCVFSSADNKDKDVILEKKKKRTVVGRPPVPERRHGVGRRRRIVPGGPLWLLKAVLCASFLIEFEERSPQEPLEITRRTPGDVTLY